MLFFIVAVITAILWRGLRNKECGARDDDDEKKWSRPLFYRSQKEKGFFFVGAGWRGATTETDHLYFFWRVFYMPG